MKRLWILVVVLLCGSSVFSQPSNTILVVQRNANRLEKSKAVISASSNPAAGVEQIQYRGYYINLEPAGPDYHVQIFTMIHYGSLQVSSIFASQFQSSIEYAYSYDPAKHEIRQDHFVFPANSLTGWANPDEYVLMRQFDWNQRFPSGCDGSVYTSEEFGREYMESSCFHDRDSALKFAKKFINYALGRRGLN